MNTRLLACLLRDALAPLPLGLAASKKSALANDSSIAIHLISVQNENRGREKSQFMANTAIEGLLMSSWIKFLRVGSILWIALLTLSLPAHALENHSVQEAPDSSTAQIFLCVDPDWRPFEAIDEHGKHTGIAADLIELITDRAGLSVTLHATKTWEETVAASKAGQCQLLSFLNQTLERSRWLIFTEPLLIDPNVLITREDAPPWGDLASLKGHSIAIPRESSIYGRVQKDFPNLTLIGVDSEYEAFDMVSNHKADMTLRSRIIAGQNIKEKGWFNLKIAYEIPGYENYLRMGVLKSRPELRDRLNMGIATLTKADRDRAINRYVEIKTTTIEQTDYTLVIFLTVILVAVIVTSLWWMRRLRQLNERLKLLSVTDALTGLLNRTGFSASFPMSVERAQRYERPLSVLILDLDHFKQVNDQFGHLMGDRVLVEFAKLIQAMTRQADALYRWGGEEFLIICHETPPDQVLQLGERILAKVRRHNFPTQKPMTVSAGMATLYPDDTMNRLIQRADEALYQAKDAGRDQIRVASRTSSHVPTESASELGFVQLNWKAAYTCGVPLIDEQHRSLFTHTNALLTSVLTEKSTEDIAARIDLLIDEVVQHFKDEEAILESAGYVDLEEHAALHRQLVSRALELLALFQKGTLGVGELFQFLANDVVARHMLIDDRKFFPCLAQD